MEKTLILDAGGVLIAEPVPRLLRAVALAGEQVTPDALAAWFQQEVREDLWSGRISEERFWALFLQEAGVPTEHAGLWRAQWRSYLQPTAGALSAQDWATRTRTAILSNHLPQWLEPALAGAGLDALLDPQDVLISARLGACKPGRRIFELAGEQVGTGPDVLFVDDQQRNLDMAQHVCGWTTLRAAPENNLWIGQVEAWLDR